MSSNIFHTEGQNQYLLAILLSVAGSKEAAEAKLNEAKELLKVAPRDLPPFTMPDLSR